MEVVLVVSLLFTIITVQVGTVDSRVDYTDVAKARGTDVVCAAVQGLQEKASAMLSVPYMDPDSPRNSVINSSLTSQRYVQFLRRVAYVGTLDGVEDHTFLPNYNGGIWQIDEGIFEFTQLKNIDTLSVADQNFIQNVQNWIQEAFEISWTASLWVYLLQPQYSLLAAAFHILIMEEVKGVLLPQSNNITGQAAFWNAFSNGSAEKFIERVKDLELLDSGNQCMLAL